MIKYSRIVNSLSAGVSARRLLVVLSLLCLVLGQGLTVNHHHEGELQAQFDCHICLKSSTDNEALFFDSAPLLQSTAYYYNPARLLEAKSSVQLLPAARDPPSFA